MSSLISAAARVLKVGQAFSDSNKKLREDVATLVKWLYDTIGENVLPEREAFGWVVRQEHHGAISWAVIGFKIAGDWRYVASEPDNHTAEQATDFCRALAGEHGDRLIVWLEETTTQRRQYQIALEAFQVVMRLDPVEAEASRKEPGLLWTLRTIWDARAKLTRKEIEQYADELERQDG